MNARRLVRLWVAASLVWLAAMGLVEFAGISESVAALRRPAEQRTVCLADPRRVPAFVPCPPADTLILDGPDPKHVYARDYLVSFGGLLGVPILAAGLLLAGLGWIANWFRGRP